MVALDSKAPNAEEHKLQAVTKLRYMQFREEQSSTCSHGFRIEAMKVIKTNWFLHTPFLNFFWWIKLTVIITLQFRGSPPVTDLKTVKSDEEVNSTLALFLGDRHDIKQRLVARLNDIRSKLDRSHYFKTHEVSWAYNKNVCLSISYKIKINLADCG